MGALFGIAHIDGNGQKEPAQDRQGGPHQTSKQKRQNWLKATNRETQNANTYCSQVDSADGGRDRKAKFYQPVTDMVLPPLERISSGSNTRYDDK